MEHVRVVLTQLPRDLDWQGVERAMEESCGLEGKEQVYKALNGQLYNMDLDLQREAKHLITLLTEKVGEGLRPSARTRFASSFNQSDFFLLLFSSQMQPELRRYIQHISLSPDSINNDDVGSWLFF